MMEQIQSQKVVSLGGLNSNVNHIQLSDNEPGSAVELQNFEASLYGGYRRLSGFLPLSDDDPTIDPAGSEGRVLMVCIFNDAIYAARKQKSGNTYKFYAFNGSTWDAMSTPVRVSSNVIRIRYKEFNFKGTNTIAFCDGVNPNIMFDGTTWSEIKTTNTGADYTHAGGAMAINASSYINVFRNTLFYAQGNLLVYSAPLAAYDYTAASGAGQIPVGFQINQIMPFRDALYVFGINNIKKVTLKQNSTSTGATVSYFALEDVTSNVGCVASDSVIEIDGNLVFLSQDGFRPISGTDRIGDVQLETVSKKIQQLITSEIVSNDMSELTSVIVRNKSQMRFFFSSASKPASSTFGIIGCLRGDANNGFSWEWGRLKGIRAACTASKYIGAVEYVLHGDYDGKVFRQEQGNDFNGAPVEAIYATPFLDFGAAGVRKTLRKVRLFVRPEGVMNINARLVFDWNDLSKLNPSTYGIEADSTGLGRYGIASYGSAVYGATSTPVLISNVEGSGFSVQLRYSTVDLDPPYTIQGALYDFSVEGRK